MAAHGRNAPAGHDRGAPGVVDDRDGSGQFGAAWPHGKDGMQQFVDGGFRGGQVACGAARLQWLAAGQGELVIDLVPGAAPTRFHALLAERFRVATLDVPAAGDAASAGLAAALGDVAAAAGHQRCSLVVRGAALPLAVQALRERPGLVEALVVLAPPPADEAALDALSAAALPLLVLSGTRGTASPPEAGSPYRARVRGSHYVLVYDAGDAIDADRPEATASVAGDFLARRERFIIASASGLIHP